MKATVLMSVFNGEKYLKEAIESILGQTFSDFEFLIINDGSTDSSKEIILSYNDPRIRYVENEKNIGLTKSLNKGLALAQGEYIARMDADDVSLPERLEKQVNFLDSQKDIVLAGSHSDFINEDGKVFKTNKRTYTKEELYYNLTFGNVFPHSSAMFRKKEILDMGGYDDFFKQAQDHELWFRVSRRFAIGMVEHILVRWRESKENISSKHKESQRDSSKEVFIRCIRGLFSGPGELNADEVMCFHDVYKTGQSKTKIGFGKILLLRKINRRLISQAPPYIEKKALHKICNQRAKLFLKKRVIELIK